MSNAPEDYVLDGYLPSDPDIETPTLQKVDEIKAPTRVDLRPLCSPVEDQRNVGSCVANAIVGALEFHQIRNQQPMKDLSRLFVYYNSRRLHDHIGKEGTTIKKAMASILGWGVCPAGMWPYQFEMVNERPTQDAYTQAQRFMGVQIAETTFGLGCRDALANGLPVAFGMKLAWGDFGPARQTGVIKPPQDGNWHPDSGGHAMLLVGYDDHRHAWLVRNSWGPNWGEGGHVWIDYDYLDHYTLGENYRDNPFVVGQVQDIRAYSVTGPSIADFVAQASHRASTETRIELGNLRQQIASDLDQSLGKAKQSIRDRLRGPGVGGGY